MSQNPRSHCLLPVTLHPSWPAATLLCCPPQLPAASHLFLLQLSQASRVCWGFGEVLVEGSVHIQQRNSLSTCPLTLMLVQTQSLACCLSNYSVTME